VNETSSEPAASPSALFLAAPCITLESQLSATGWRRWHWLRRKAAKRRRAVFCAGAANSGKLRGWMDMDDWIPFEEGKYLAERAFLVSADDRSVVLEKPYIEIFKGRHGSLHMRGGGLIQNFLMVELLDEHDHLDILVDLGSGYAYRLNAPQIQAGKVFSPHVRSSLRFVPCAPWEQLSTAEFEKRLSRLKPVSI
jgi:hypothetical protein